jgi:hypothetical protein
VTLWACLRLSVGLKQTKFDTIRRTICVYISFAFRGLTFRNCIVKQSSDASAFCNLARPVALGASVFAQDNALTVDELVAKNVEAKGGVDAL